MTLDWHWLNLCQVELLGCELKSRTSQFFGCFCVFLYENAFKFNPYNVLYIKFIQWPWVKITFSVVYQNFQTTKFPETAGPITIKFCMQPLGKGKKNIYIWSIHITRMAAMLTYGKSLTRLVLHSHWATCLEPWKSYF